MVASGKFGGLPAVVLNEDARNCLKMSPVTVIVQCSSGPGNESVVSLRTHFVRKGDSSLGRSKG